MPKVIFGRGEEGWISFPILRHYRCWRGGSVPGPCQARPFMGRLGLVAGRAWTLPVGRKGRPTSIASAAVCGHHPWSCLAALRSSRALCCLLPASALSGTAAVRGPKRHRAQIVSVFKEIVLQSTIAELTKVFSVGSTSLSFISFPFLSLLFFPPNMKWDKTVIKYAIKGIKGFVKIWGIWSSANGCSACVADFDFCQRSQVHQGLFLN